MAILDIYPAFAQFTLINILGASAFFSVLGICYQVVYHRFFHPLSKFPGPFWPSVTRIPQAYHSLIQDEHLWERELRERYGTVLRITPDQLLISDVTRMPEIYHRHVNKSKFYLAGSFGKTESIFNIQNWRHHAEDRKLLAAAYSFTNIKKAERLFDARMTHWVNRLDELFVRTGAKFDISYWAIYLAYDVISDLGFGAPFGFVETGSDVGGLIKAFHDGLPLYGIMGRLYPFTNFIKRTWIGEKFFVARPEHNTGIGALMRFRDKLVAQRLKDIEAGTAGERVDMMQTFLEAKEDSKDLDLAWVKAELLLVMIAGADTTGTTLQGIIFNLMSHPQVCSKFMAEIDEATQAGHLSPVPQYDQVLTHCPYYIAVIKEVLRHDSPTPCIFPRTGYKGGFEIAGKWAPEDTELTMNAYIVSRDKGVYGEDADDFRPERWLEDKERAKDMEKYSMAFGYGARACLGKEIVMMELFKGPLMFFRMFQPKFADEKPKPKYVVLGGVAHWEDMWITLERRAIVA